MCGAPQFKENQVAPAPSALPPSDHAIDKDADGDGDAADGVPFFDHEFGGFTARRTWETACVLPPGTYTAKFVIHDVADSLVDAALFIEQDSLKLYSFLPADFNLDGTVGPSDFSILSANWMQCGRKFTQGDASGDGCVNATDFSILSGSWNQTGGNKNLKFDFDRDGVISGTDDLIWQRGLGLMECASRFEGDADGDGDVDGDDTPPSPANQLSALCGSGGQGMAAGGGEELTGGGVPPPDAGDIDEDGDVDRDDVDLFGKMIGAE